MRMSYCENVFKIKGVMHLNETEKRFSLLRIEMKELMRKINSISV